MMDNEQNVQTLLTDIYYFLNLPVRDGAINFEALPASRKTRLLFLLGRQNTVDTSRTGALGEAVVRLLNWGYTAPKWLLRDALTALELEYSTLMGQVEASHFWENVSLARVRESQNVIATAMANDGAL